MVILCLKKLVQNFVKKENVILWPFKEYVTLRRKPWSSGRALGSRSEGCGFNPCPILDGSGVKAMPGSIPTPSSGSLQKK